MIDDYISKIKTTLDLIFNEYQTKFQRASKVAVLVSGGIDSSIIAYYAKEYFPNTNLFSFGTAQNVDVPYATILQKYLHIPLHFIQIEENHIFQNQKKVISILKSKQIDANLMQISLALGYYLAFEEIRNHGIMHVFTGQGPDVLFAGYKKYLELPIEYLNKQISKDVALLETDILRDHAMAEQFDILLDSPYLDSRFISSALQIPGELKIVEINNAIIEKWILREFGKTLSLPEEILHRKKKAFQYSSGIQKMINSINKNIVK